jgi:hypothetical protein
MQREPLARPTSQNGASDTGELCVPRWQTLDTWVAHRWADGVQIDGLEDLEVLRIDTHNSTYDLAVVCPASGWVLVRGGRYFPDWTPAVFLGSSFGGGLLKRHGVHAGLQMEFYCAGRRILTSPVATIAPGLRTRSDLLVASARDTR